MGDSLELEFRIASRTAVACSGPDVDSAAGTCEGPACRLRLFLHSARVWAVRCYWEAEGMRRAFPLITAEAEPSAAPALNASTPHAEQLISMYAPVASSYAGAPSRPALHCTAEADTHSASAEARESWHTFVEWDAL